MHDANDVEVLTSVTSDQEAAMIVGALTDLGIHATAAGQFTAGFRAEAPGEVKILVGAAQLELAKEELARLRSGQSDIDWSQVDVGEPED
jgi:hypothetical protein